MASDDAVTHLIPKPPTLRFARVVLHVVAGPDAGKETRLAPGRSRIGTSPTSVLPLTDPTVSRLHCEVHVESGTVRLVDTESTNGTIVDGVEVFAAKISPGSSVRIGATALRFDFDDAPLTLTLSPRDQFGPLIGASAEMRRIYAVLEAVSPTDNTVLIQGETGTGKEVVARAIHGESKRAHGPFVAVDCGAIAESLIESELFGHVRGAFTGATTERRGLFEEADGGTLFLDEIGELPLALQPKLLRVLESREVRRVGANVAKKLNVRVLAATNRPLARAVNEGAFREDLYYRLAVFEIVLPPLRARRDDIAMLANHFHQKVTGDATPLSDAIVSALVQRSWPGNVRELRNFVERSVTLGWTSMRQGNASSMSNAGSGAPPVPVLEGLVPIDLPLKEAREVWTDQFETLYVAALLRRTGGNVTRAAQIAGVNRRYLHRLIAEHRIRGASEEAEEEGT